MKIMNENRTSRMFMAACAALLVLAGTRGLEAADKREAPQPATCVELLKIVELIEPSYPLGLTIEGVVRGDVEVVIGVDATGRLDDYLVTSYSRVAFVREVETVLKKWRFEPMRVNGVPVWSRAQVSFSFEARGVVITRMAMDAVNMLTDDMLETSRRVQVLSAQSQLDRPLTVRRSVSPLYPAQLAEGSKSGAATVEFFVDESGTVRLPVIDTAEHPWFGEAAAQAVLQWQFDPPLRKGQPTVVKVKQQFMFNP